MPILGVALLLLLISPILLVWAFFELTSAGLEEAGIPPALAGISLLLMVVGSFFNIPLTRRKIVQVEESKFFGLVKQTKLQARGISINVGGGVIPILLAGGLLLQTPPVPVVIATAVVSALAWRMSRVVPNRGVQLPLLVPPLAAALVGFLVSPENPAPVAFISGVLGVLVGADLLNLPMVQREAEGMMSIGGAGVFDGIILVGVFSALLAALPV